MNSDIYSDIYSDSNSDSDVASPAVWGPAAWYLIHNITRHLMKTNPEGTQKIVCQNAAEDFFHCLLIYQPIKKPP